MQSAPIWHERYQIQRRLSKRRGRQTLLAQDLQTQDQVVIKLLLLGSDDVEWLDLKLFEREAQTLQALSHPAIPRYRDFFEIRLATGRGMALVQSYIEAPSLQAWIQRGRRFTEAEVRELALKGLEILVDLHGLNPPVIHRDLKPSNVLLGSDGQVYVVDFGAVQAATPRDSGTYTVVGSYGYMPLEQFGGRTVPASDLYGLGMTLVHLLTGRHPADLPTTGSRLRFEEGLSLSPAFLDWLGWLTEPLVEDRPDSAALARRALQQGSLPFHRRQVKTIKEQMGDLEPRPQSTLAGGLSTGHRMGGWGAVHALVEQLGTGGGSPPLPSTCYTTRHYPIQIHQNREAFVALIPILRQETLSQHPLAWIPAQMLAMAVGAATLGVLLAPFILVILLLVAALEFRAWWIGVLSLIIGAAAWHKGWLSVGWRVLTEPLDRFIQVSLRIDPSWIRFETCLGWIRWRRVRPSPSPTITHLELIRYSSVQVDLILWAGDCPYPLGQIKNIRAEDLETLGLQLSQWLGIPLHRKPKSACHSNWTAKAM